MQTYQIVNILPSKGRILPSTGSTLNMLIFWAHIFLASLRGYLKETKWFLVIDIENKMSKMVTIKPDFHLTSYWHFIDIQPTVIAVFFICTALIKSQLGLRPRSSGCTLRHPHTLTSTAVDFRLYWHINNKSSSLIIL